MLKASAEVLLASKKTKALMAGLLVAGMMATSLVSAPSPAEASIFFNVNSTGDQADPNTADNLCDVDPGSVGSQCTLRAAIQQANASPGSDSIGFDIPDSGALRAISPQSQLPAITAPVSIDGYTQGSLTSDPSDDATPNTKDVGDDAVIKIELNGASAGFGADGLTIKSPPGGVLIRGLAIGRFNGSGIVVDDASLGNSIEGNFIGTDRGGTQSRQNADGVLITNNSEETLVGGDSPDKRNVISGNSFNGVDISNTGGNEVKGNYIGTTRDGTGKLGNDTGVALNSASSNGIGGPSAGEGNVISGNEINGVALFGNSPDSNRVLGNLIGTTASGTGELHNGENGVGMNGSFNTVGDGSSGGANTIAFNGTNGVEIEQNSANGNRVLSNAIFSNGIGLGIGLNNDGTTPNDTGDADTGPNNLQNFPVLSSAKTGKKGTTVAGKLNSNPNSTFLVQFFSNPSGTDEGKTLIGQKEMTTDASGNASFSLKTKKVGRGQNITATAMNKATFDTSEFSAPKKVVRR